MEVALPVIAALALDLMIGDPRFLPHPVTGIGFLISWLEGRLRKNEDGAVKERWLGILLVVILLFMVCTLTLIVLWVADGIHPLLRTLLEIWLVSTTIAVRGLDQAAMRVFHALIKGDLAAAQTRVGYIVGRDTDALSEGEVARAAVETVAENIVDAVVAPMFYALLGGAPLALLYRAVNTLDSMVGYKNEKYRYFGWASARLDDVLNYIPARITGGIICLIASLGRKWSGKGAWRTVRADAGKHPSPNSGIPEAAVAGALGVRLGGCNRYGGIPSMRAIMGKTFREPLARDIMQTVWILRWSAGAIGIILCFFVWIL